MVTKTQHVNHVVRTSAREIGRKRWQCNKVHRCPLTRIAGKKGQVDGPGLTFNVPSHSDSSGPKMVAPQTNKFSSLRGLALHPYCVHHRRQK